MGSAADADTARDGQWQAGPATRSSTRYGGALGRLPIVAEDLGVITPEVDALRDRHAVPGMEVLQFAVDDPAFSLSDVPEHSVCYTGTHDNDTTVGWFTGSPDDLRSADSIKATQKAVLAMTDGSPETVHDDLIKAAMSTQARIAIAPMQDYLGLGSEARLNTPGTSANNWRWRLRGEQINDELCDKTAKMVCDTGREMTN